MGAWGAGSFENDDALDWLGVLAGAYGPTPIRDALSAAAEAEGYVEAPEASAALAAAEVAAALFGHPSPTLPDEAAGWVRANAGAAQAGLRELARRAVDAVARDSELRDLWLETGDAGEWEAAVRDLRSRLG
jgi:hypothetical protein